VSSSQ
jgi:hypothetical protein